MSLARLLRVDTDPRTSPHGLCLLHFKDADHVVAINPDGTYVIEPGDEFRSFGWERTYAPRRRQILHAALKARLPRRWILGR